MGCSDIQTPAAKFCKGGLRPPQILKTKKRVFTPVFSDKNAFLGDYGHKKQPHADVSD